MLVPPVLSELFAVVLLSESFGAIRLQWDSKSRSWLQSDAYGMPGFFAPKSEPATDQPEYAQYWEQSPRLEDLHAAAALAEALQKRRSCGHCGAAALAFHAILTDVYGDPTLTCILRPDPAVVASFGGGGTKKHYGGPDGCRAVAGAATYRRESYFLESGYSLFGEPLTTLDAISMAWCSRCSDTAHNVREHQRRLLQEQLNREPTAEEVAVAVRRREEALIEAAKIRHTLDAMGDRSRVQMVQEMRAAMSGRLPDSY